MSKRSSFSKTFVWIILGLLILGLAGFGATNLSGTVRTVAKVGDQTISVDDYARELRQQMRAIEAQTGQAMSFEQAQAFGVDRQALAQLVTLAALDHETDGLGLSIGDENLRREIVQIRAFEGIDGQFDREAYRFALEQANLTEAGFEADLRAEAARTIVQAAIVQGVSMPETMTDTLVGWLGARRSFTWARLDATDLAEPLPEPTEAELRAHYEENAERFTLPESKRITYALLVPEMLLDGIEVEEAALRTLYAERADQYDQPERRLVERLAFLDEEAARDAMAQIEVGGTTFERLVEDRGLDLADVDLGDVAIGSLGAAGEAVFAAGVGDVVGPLPSDLGPALYRVNGVLAAQSIPFEEAAEELRDELAGDRARRMIERMAEEIDDLLAGGATLEELAAETEMVLGSIDWTAQSRDGVAAYADFRAAARAVTEEDFPEVIFLEDGGITALRLEETLPERPEPFEAARDRVAENWRLARTEAALSEQAEAAVARLGEGVTFAGAGLEPRVEEGLTRRAFVEGTPPGFMQEVFALETGEVAVMAGDGTVVIVRLDETLPPAQGAETEMLREAIAAEFDQALANALFNRYAADVQTRAQPQVDQRAVEAVHANFR